MLEPLNRTAAELFHHYRKQYSDLLNTYCQIKNKYPYKDIPEVSRALWRLAVCVEAWHSIAVKLMWRRHQGE